MFVKLEKFIVVEVSAEEVDGFEWVPAPDIEIGSAVINGFVWLPDVAAAAVSAHLGTDRVTMRQARLALHAIGKLTAVNEAVAADPVAEIEWNHASTVERSSPLVAQLVAALGLDADALFEHAATL